MSQPELFYLPPSPFSWRAKWALDAAGISYKCSPYGFSPFYLGELPFRWRIGKLFERITAPMMLLPSEQGGGLLTDSTDIARWADAHSSSPGQLFPADRLKEVDRWLQAADALLSLFRREMAEAGLKEPRIVDSMLPPGLSGLSLVVARYSVRCIFQRLATKYKQDDAAAQADQVAADLAAAAAAVAAHPAKLLLPGSSQLTYAEIALASALNKAAEVNKPLPPAAASSSAAANSTAKAAGAAAASAGDAASAAAAETMADCMPVVQQLLQQFPELLQWARETAQQHWAAGASMPSS
uniref:GST N-terminal domain-containing protein n=1 Tax=Tetradesmus obliquus TaxID=3088 RepID=A0A383VMC5_TETOB|eukprot:jgi/Sobl393_1/4176/SZX65566.1